MKHLIYISICILFLVNCFDNSTSIEKSKKALDNTYLEKGQKMALSTFGVLSQNLQKAMKEGGVSNAVNYCNLTASPLVDSLELLNNVSIKRTSLKIRNPNNKPADYERMQLEKYQKQFELGKKLKPTLYSHNDQTTFYAPIHVMPLCQKCHGTIGGELMKEDYETIQNLYPTDKAIGYKSGDLRGMWSITFKE